MACSTTVAKYISPRLVAGFRTRYPDVAVEINVMSRRAAVEWLSEGRAEIAVVSRQLSHPRPGLCTFSDRSGRADCAVGPPVGRWAHRRPQDSLAAPFIIREPTAGTDEVLAKGLAAHGYSIAELQTVLTLTNAEAIEMSVEEGIGVSFVSRLAAARGLALGKAVEVPVAGMKLSRQIYMARHQRRPGMPLRQAFWDFAFDPANEAMRWLPGD